MTVILNPRGTAGAGKTELVRRILARYGSSPRPGAVCTEGREALYRPGRRRPFGYRLQHPCGGSPLVVIGHYEGTSGGCDTIRAVDGGLAEVVRTAEDFARAGHDVVMEGLRLSSDVEHTLALARSQALRVLRLTTPLPHCVRNLLTRRRAGGHFVHAFASRVAAEDEEIEAACERLRPHASVEALGFEEALARAETLLGLAGARWRQPPLTSGYGR